METEIRKKTINSLVWKLLERGGSSFVSIIVQIVMARILAPDDFGALAILLVFVNIGNVFVQSGLNTALVQNPDVDDTDYSTVFWLSFAISLILFTLVFIFAPAVADYYDSAHLIWPLRMLALILVINAYNATQVAFIQRALEFRKIFNATLISVLVSGVLGIGFAVLGFGLWALVVQQISYQICNCVVLVFQIPWRPQLVFSAARAKILFGFGWKLLASGLLDTVYRSLSDLIIGKQFSATQLGYVSQGKKYPMALGLMLDGAIQPVMLSAVSRVQDDIAYVKRLVRRALKTSTFLIVPCMACFAVVAEPTVRLLLGEKWLICVPFLQIYCFDYALLPIHTSNLQALNGMGRSDLFLKLELIKKAYGLVFILFAAFVLKDVYWIVGVTIITGIFSTFVNAWPNKKVIGYSYVEQLKDIAPAFGISLIAGVVALPIAFLALPDIMQIVLQVAVMMTVYLLLAKLLRIEAFDYLDALAKEMINGRSDKQSTKEGSGHGE